MESNSTIEQFAINSSTGALTSTNVTTGVNDRAGNLAADPQSKFVFAGYSATGSNLQNGCTVVSYTIGAGGQLTVADQQKMQNNCDTIASLATDPNGANLYVSWSTIMTGGGVTTYTIDRSNGHLTNSSPDVHPCCGPALPNRIVLDPSANHVYVSRGTPHHYPGSGGWDVYLRNPATGALASVGMFDTPQNPTEYLDGAFVLGGKYFIATEGIVYHVYSIDPATGMGTFMSSQFADTGAIASDPSGNFVVTSGYAHGTVQSWRANADGTLTAVSGGNAGNGASAVRFDRTGRYVYIENPGSNGANNQIFAFAYDPSNANLTPVSGSPFTTKAQPINITTAGH